MSLNANRLRVDDFEPVAVSYIRFDEAFKSDFLVRDYGDVLRSKRLRVVVDAKEVKRVIIVPAEEEYGDKVPAILNKVDGKEKMTVFGMNPPTSEVAYQWEMFGFAVLQSLGIKADEL